MAWTSEGAKGWLSGAFERLTGKTGGYLKDNNYWQFLDAGLASLPPEIQKKYGYFVAGRFVRTTDELPWEVIEQAAAPLRGESRAKWLERMQNHSIFGHVFNNVDEKMLEDWGNEEGGVFAGAGASQAQTDAAKQAEIAAPAQNEIVRGSGLAAAGDERLRAGWQQGDQDRGRINSFLDLLQQPLNDSDPQVRNLLNLAQRGAMEGSLNASRLQGVEGPYSINAAEQASNAAGMNLLAQLEAQRKQNLQQTLGLAVNQTGQTQHSGLSGYDAGSRNVFQGSGFRQDQYQYGKDYQQRQEQIDYNKRQLAAAKLAADRQTYEDSFIRPKDVIGAILPSVPAVATAAFGGTRSANSGGLAVPGSIADQKAGGS